MTVGYTEEFKRQREAAEVERQRQRAEMERENREARQRYIATLEAEREAKRKEGEAETELELLPYKEQERRQWLIDHPEYDAAYFDAKVWPRIREQKYTGRAALIQREIAAQRARGR